MHAADADIESYSFQNHPAPFTGLVVDTNSDDDLETCSNQPADCSLRGAITLANTMPARTPSPLTRPSCHPADHPARQRTLPQITDDLTINGAGANLLTIDGANSYPPFYIDSGVTATISGMTIQNSQTANRYGGGIYQRWAR